MRRATRRRRWTSDMTFCPPSRMHSTAIAPGAPVLHDAVPDNIALEAEFGDRATRPRRHSRRPTIVVEHTFRNQRIVNAQMEPRAALGAYDAADDRYTLISGSQGVHRQKTALAECLRRRAGARARDLPRRRRRVRAAHQCLSRAGRGRVGGAPRRAAGALDRRPLGMLPLRSAGPRSRHRRRGWRSTAPGAFWHSRSRCSAMRARIRCRTCR